MEKHMNKLEKEVYEILCKVPIDIIEEDQYQQSVTSSERWFLTAPRTDGIAKGSTKIGYFNIWMAAKIIADATKKPFGDESTVDTLATICDNLSNYGFLKESPEYKRERFKLITNEELNDKRKERSSTNQSSND
jgi:hypothetical protein